MSTNKTTNLNLHSWIGSDPVRMIEFNENFVAIDEALGNTWADVAARAKVEFGSYAGTGQGGASYKNTLQFSFAPKLVIIDSPSNGMHILMHANTTWTKCYFAGSTQTVILNWENDGKRLRWYHDSQALYQFNYSGNTYYYMAIG